MKLIFVESRLFEKLVLNYWSIREYFSFQQLLLENPKLGVVLQNTGGLRKVRFKSKDSGKRGGVRVIYYFHERLQRLFLLTIYAKNEIDDLTVSQKCQLKQFVEEWINEQA